MSHSKYDQQTMMIRTQGGDLNGLFAENALRRSAWFVAVSWALLLVPAFMLSGDWKALLLIATGWLAITGIIMCTPILIWCLIEEAVIRIRRRIVPQIEELDLSEHAYRLLKRHGFESIESVERVSDDAMLMLSNMDKRALREIRRGVSLWRYSRWQAHGFPADEMP